jgi:type I restriction enzyme, S subunit
VVVKSSGSATSIVSGKASLITEGQPPFVFSNFLLRLRPRPDIIRPEFLHAFLTSTVTRERIKRMVSATTYPNLRVDEYVRSTVPVPPLDEQARLVENISDGLTRSKTVRAFLLRSVELLTEHRQALITAAVTGELEVATVAA